MVRTPRTVVPLAICVACALLPIYPALFPEVAPGRYDVPQVVRDRAAILWALCWIPALRYSILPAERRAPVPFLPVIGVLYALYYALAPMLGTVNTWGSSNDWALGALDPTADLGPAVDFALAGWITSMCGYGIVALCWAPKVPKLRESIGQLRVATVRSWAIFFLVFGQGIVLLRRLADLPIVLGGFGTLAGMLSCAGLVILIVLARKGALGAHGRLLVGLLATGTVFVQLGGGATYNVIYIVFCIFVAYWFSGARIPLWCYVGAVAATLSFVAIRGAMTEWRKRVWYAAEEHGPLERSMLMASIVSDNARMHGVAGSVAHGWRLISRRSAHSDLLADVIRRTPRDVPYWDGYTYRSLVGVFIPRVLWPGKPQKNLGQDFGHRYAYLSPRDFHTTINLPLLVELYINFGPEGVILGMFLIGVLYRSLERVCNQPGQNVVVSAAGTQLMIPLFLLECDFSLQFGGIVLQLGALLVVLHVILRLHGRRETQAAFSYPRFACVPADLPTPNPALRVYRAAVRRAPAIDPRRAWDPGREMAAD